MRRQKWMTKAFVLMFSMILLLTMMPTMAFASMEDGMDGSAEGAPLHAVHQRL